MNNVAASSSTDRADLFLDTIEIHQHIHMASLVEKDFWVCWVLSKLFSRETPVSLLFKGDTSLSKAYPVINRLSEDIDLSLNRLDLGFDDDSDPRTALSNKERERRLDQIISVSTNYVTEVLFNSLRDDFSTILGMPGDVHEWQLEIDPEDQQILLFSYPVTSVTPAIADYVSPIVRMEFGARSDHWPNENRVITSYAAESFSDMFELPSCTVSTLKAERTFWEKAIILHQLFHGGVNHLHPKLARHYYDFFCLSTTQYGLDAIAQPDILEAVAEHAGVFFKRAWAKYDEAKPGTLKLVPSDEMKSLLKKDYLGMESLFFDEPPQFEAIINVLAEVEEQINNTKN